jgi:2'-hydroxyisoflavone reductase
MKLLILGGTRFLGRHLTETALARGHEVTLFNRGQSNTDLFPEVEQLRGDRDGDLEALKGRKWDAVIDTSGYQPHQVREVAELLKDSVGHYTFISSCSVYADDVEGETVREDGRVATMTPEQVEDVRVGRSEVGHFYGALKHLCERTLEEVMPGRVLNIRSGLLVGPHDNSDRFTYWPYRVAQGGEVLVPDVKHPEVYFIDARDTASWNIRMVEGNHTGVYNAMGSRYTFSQVVEACKRVSGSDATLTLVSEAFLQEKEIGEWMELPLWVMGEGELKFRFWRMSDGKAVADGLTFRPLADTIRDTLFWDQTRPADEERKAGLDPQKEQELLAAWHGRSDN